MSPADEPITPELEAAIHAADGPEPYLVYADYLTERGHPRGELIMLMHAGADEESRAHLLAHRDVLAGAALGDWAQSKWKLGFVETLAVRVSVYERTRENAEVSHRLREMLSHPATRFLRRLFIGEIGAGADYSPLIQSVIETKRPLHQLDVGAEVDGRIGDVSALYGAHPQLKKLALRGADVELGPVVRLPQLESLIVETAGLRTAEPIGHAKWPALHSLCVWFGAEGTATIRQLEAVLQGSAPRLTRFGVMNAAETDGICEAIVRSPLAQKLESLDLSLGTMTDEGAGLLVQHADRFERLTALDVSRNCIRHRARERLAKVFPFAEVGDQDPRHPFPSVRSFE